MTVEEQAATFMYRLITALAFGAFALCAFECNRLGFGPNPKDFMDMRMRVWGLLVSGAWLMVVIWSMS